jgi:hypothetical protein
MSSKRGRPPINGAPGMRYQVHLPPGIAEKLRAIGEGSLSQGIIRAYAIATFKKGGVK